MELSVTWAERTAAIMESVACGQPVSEALGRQIQAPYCQRECHHTREPVHVWDFQAAEVQPQCQNYLQKRRIKGRSPAGCSESWVSVQRAALTVSTWLSSCDIAVTLSQSGCFLGGWGCLHSWAGWGGGVAVVAPRFSSCCLHVLPPPAPGRLCPPASRGIFQEAPGPQGYCLRAPCRPSSFPDPSTSSLSAPFWPRDGHRRS